jgi:yeast amino acid transporter
MAIMKRNSGSGSSEGVNTDAEYGNPKTEYSATGADLANIDSDGAVNYNDHQHLHRGLKSRHITMIAIGGAIGTGLIIGTGKALADSGYVQTPPSPLSQTDNLVLVPS